MTDDQLRVLEEKIRDILTTLGEDPTREGLKETPRRKAKAWQFLVSGYRQNPKEVVGRGVFASESSEMILVKDIEFYSLCEHHLLPFFGRAHVAYIPNKKMIGLSKIPRVIDVFSRRLQVQERLTSQVANSLMEILEPRGVAVILEASHLCMMMRGVEKQSSRTTTSAMRGVFMDDVKTRQEFLQLLAGVVR